MFNDRIEIQNPGGLYGEVSIDEIMSSKKDIRNKNAVRILEDLKVLENRGSGIPTILREMRDLKLEPPKLEERRGDFWVTFKNHTLLTKQDKEWLKDFKMDFTENETLALSFIRKNEVMTNSDYQKICNLNRDRSLIEIKGLLNKGLIKAQGVGRGTVYVFSDKIMLKDEAYTPQDDSTPPKMTPQDDNAPPKMTPQDDPPR
jgi:ATP-dependent DNA helicase RecG